MDSDKRDITLETRETSDKPAKFVMLSGKEKLVSDQWKIMEQKLTVSTVATLNVLSTAAENLYREIVVEKKDVSQAILGQLNVKVPSSYVTLSNRYCDLRKFIVDDSKLNKYFKLQEIETVAAEESVEVGSVSEAKKKKKNKTEEIRKRLEEKRAGIHKEVTSLKQTNILNQRAVDTINTEFAALVGKLRLMNKAPKTLRKSRSAETAVQPLIEINDLESIIYDNRYVELIALSFISAVNLLRDEQIDENKSLDNEHNKKLYELAVGISNLYDKLNPLSENKIELNKITDIDSDVISGEILKDLFNAKNNFLRRLDYQPVFLSKNFPQLIFDNSYNKYLNINSIKPYKSQIEVLAGLIDANNSETSNGFLCLLKTLTGEGKTSLIISLANTVNKILDSRKGKGGKDMEIIFCCNDRLNTVSYQVGQYAHGMNVPFGVASEVQKTNSSGETYYDVHVTNNKNCKKQGKKRLLTISDIVSTGRLLEKAEAKNKEYVLFFDEPTSFLDENNPELIIHLTNIFKNLPPNTILSSATLPKTEDIAPLTTYFNKKYPSGKILAIESSKVKIGCQVNDFRGKLFVPNNEITYKPEMDKLINKLMETSFVKKLYTPYVTSLLWNNIEKLIRHREISSTDVENFRTKFGNPSNLNQEAVQDCAINYLTEVAKKNNPETTLKFNTYLDTDVMLEEPIDFTKLIEYKQRRFKTQTLIVTKDPLNFTERHFSKTFDDIFKRAQTRLRETTGQRFETFYEIYQDYLEQFKTRDETIEKLELDTEGKLEKNRHIIENLKPRFNFERPNILNVNYYSEKVDYSEMDSEDNYLLVGLAMGVGIYSPTRMSKRYTNEVLSLANEGKLAYIVADTDIAYGTNYAIEHIIIDDSCFSGTNTHSISTLFQVIARAGRVGRSWRAMIYCGDEVIKILNNYIKENVETNEATQINLAVEKITLDELEKQREEMEKIKAIAEKQRDISAETSELSKIQASLNQDSEAERIEQQAAEIITTDVSPADPVSVPVPVSVSVPAPTQKLPLPVIPPSQESVTSVPAPIHVSTEKPPLPILPTPVEPSAKPLTWREREALKRQSEERSSTTHTSVPREPTRRTSVDEAPSWRRATNPTAESSREPVVEPSTKPLTWREREALKRQETDASSSKPSSRWGSNFPGKRGGYLMSETSDFEPDEITNKNISETSNASVKNTVQIRVPPSMRK